MQHRNSSEEYGSVSISLHWLMALMIIVLLIVGLIMSDMENSPLKFQIYGIHKATGIVVLGLAALRIIWRLKNAVPGLPSSMPAWQRLASHASHYGLYFFMFLMPLSGWAMSSAAGYPVSVYGLFTLPDLVGKDEGLREFFGELHEISGFALIGLLCVHAGAAVYHHVVQKDNILTRMLPFISRK